MTKTILVFVIIIIFGGITVWLFMNKSKNANTPIEELTSPSTSPEATLTASPLPTASASADKIIDLGGGLLVQDLVVGTGDGAKKGETISVNYVGTLSDGKKFDSSYDRGEPFIFPLGAGQVIKGWDLGVVGMKVGGKRKLTIPPSFGYGSQNVGNGLIPPNSTLIFEVELLGVQK